MVKKIQDMGDEKQDDTYENFRERLIESHEFPGDYIFKFIVETDNHKMARLQQLYDSARPKFSTKSSRNNKYTSLTAKVYVLDADEVIEYYKAASKISGVISL